MLALLCLRTVPTQPSSTYAGAGRGRGALPLRVLHPVPIERVGSEEEGQEGKEGKQQQHQEDHVI